MKLRQATAQAQLVTSEDNTVDDIPINGAGKGESQGYFLADGKKKVYLPNTQPDIDSTLQQLIQLIDDLIVSISQTNVAIGAPVDVTFQPKAELIKGQLEIIKDTLK